MLVTLKGQRVKNIANSLIMPNEMYRENYGEFAC